MASISDRRVLVTGGTGMIGANLVRRLTEDGWSVCVLTSLNANLVRLEDIQDRVQCLPGDVTDLATMKGALRAARASVVFHLAGTRFNPPTLSPETHFRVNVLGTLNLLEALREFPEARVIYTGSVAEYGVDSRLTERSPIAPTTLLGASKAAASLLFQTYARLYQLNSVVLRLTTPYGPWEHPRRLIPQVILSALQHQDVPLSDGRQQRDFIYMDDLVDAMLLAATRPLAAGTVLNIGSGSAISVREVVEQVLALMGNPVRALMGALPTRTDEIMRMSVDITAAREQLGWQPIIPLEAGLRRAIAWFTQHREMSLHLP